MKLINVFEVENFFSECWEWVKSCSLSFFGKRSPRQNDSAAFQKVRYYEIVPLDLIECQLRKS